MKYIDTKPKNRKHKTANQICISNWIKTYEKSIHEMIRYPSNQCQYKTTKKQNLMKHVGLTHEKTAYSCDQREYQATNKEINRHEET